MPLCDFMNAPADYRSEKMESREGKGIALERRRRWDETIPDHVRELLDDDRGHRSSVKRLIGEDAAEEFWKQVAADAKERADLRGFWLSWHLAGGFEALQGAGWNRATIFRKVRRFREVFGAHPDEYQFSWIKLDLKKAWSTELRVRLSGDDDASVM
jgi:hypothetical protein